MRILVTAGPTREHLDDVRFLSSPSSGRMGWAVAEEAVGRGHEVVLVAGPVELSDPPGVRVRRIVSALDLREACREEWPTCDAVVMTASVSDLRPAERAAGKRRKSEVGLTLELVANPDVVAELSRTRRPDQVLVGFAMQVQDAVAEARRKLREKGLDWIVLNDPASFGSQAASFRLLGRDGTERDLGNVSKTVVAGALIDLLEGARPA